MFENLADPAAIRDLDPAALVVAIESAHRQESVLVGRRMAAVAALLRHRPAATERAEHQCGYAVIDAFEQTTAEVAAAMNLSPAAAKLSGLVRRGAGQRVAQRWGPAGRRAHRLAHSAIAHQPYRSGHR